ncbi:phosphatidylcholine/phosphatidylserine synthase [soil metagenome]
MTRLSDRPTRLKPPPRELRPREIEVRKLAPNMITAASLCAGLASLHYSLLGSVGAGPENFRYAVLAIVISFILDGLDGRMARLLRVTSKFGEVFDSMADFMAFGVAPAFLIYQWKLRDAVVNGKEVELFGLAAIMLFALCAAIRLARFAANAAKKRPGAPTGKFFAGLPAPAAGGAVLIPAMLEFSPLVHYQVPATAILVWTALLAIFMVSKIPMLSIKGLKVKRALAPVILALVALVVFGIMRDGWLTASVVFGIYVLSFPLGFAGYRKAVAKEASEAALLSERDAAI